MLISILLGGLYTLGFPQAFGEGIFLLGFLALILEFLTLDKMNSTFYKALSVGLFNLGYHLVGFYWVGGTLQEFGGLPLPVAHILGLFLSLMLNPYMWGYWLWLILSPRFSLYQNRSPIYKSLWLAMLLTIFEIILPQQFPVYLGHFFTNLAPYLTFAPLGGVFLYSFFGFWLVTSIYFYMKSKQKIALTGFLVFIFFTSVQFLIPLKINKNSNKDLSIRIVQANVGNFLKTASVHGDESAIEDVIQKYYRLSTKDHLTDFDLIIWPETAYPFTLPSYQLKKGTQALPSILQDVIAQTGAELVLGGYDRKENIKVFDYYETDYNSVYHFDRTGLLKNVYHKHILIPFGETLPFGPFNKTLSKYLDTVSFFARGDQFPLFETRNKITFVTPVCYEILDTFFIKRMLQENKGAHFILNLTNDSWYGATAEPRQHLFLAKWRALEFGIPIIRSTNTGITSVVFPNGQESRRLLTGDEDVLDLKINFDDNPTTTLYQKVGLNFLLGVWLILLGIFTLWELKKNPR